MSQNPITLRFQTESTMTTLQAFNLTLEKVEELKEKGVEVSIIASKGRTNKEMIERYNTSERVLPDLWVNVQFQVSEPWHVEKISESRNYLGMCGIQFDTGGWTDHRSWELDWSFSYTGEENLQWQEANEEMEDDLNQDKEPKKEGWYGGKIKCDLCGHEYIDVHHTSCDKLECPNCLNRASFEVI
jgi:hypothetical protein